MTRHSTTGRGLSRRTILKGAGAAGALGALSLLNAACSGDDDASTSTKGSAENVDKKFNQANTTVTAEQPTPGGTLNLAGTDVTNFDYQVSFSVLQTLYTNRLLRYKTGGDVPPNRYEYTTDLATGWEQPTGDQLTIKLNPNAKFHNKAPVNGRALTSEDVKATLELARTNKPTYVYRYLSDYIRSIETPDANTVVLKLDYPTALILNAVAYYNSAIAPKEIIARDGNLEKLDIGTGPFTLDRYEKNVGFTFKKNPGYFGAPAPYVDQVELPIITDNNLRLEAFRTGKLDSIDIPFGLLENAQKTLDKSVTTLQTQPGVGWNAYWFNATKPPFNDLRVRQAFGLAIDRTAINNLVNQGQGAIRTGPVARGWSQWARPDAEVLAESKRDVAKAKQLLAAAGFADGFDIDWQYYSGTDDNAKTSQIVQQQLKDVGINLKFNLLDNTGWNKKLQDHDFSLSHWAIRAYPDPDDYLYPFFYPKGAKNFGQVDDPELTRLILEQRQATTADERKAALQEIDRRWTTDFAYATWYYEQPFAHAFSNRLRNFSARNPTDYAAYVGAFLKQS